MLKERLDFLCIKENISRKELVDGLISLSHFSNIILGRYTLAHDLADSFAKKLCVSTNYLIKCEDSSEEVLSKCDVITSKIILFNLEDSNWFENLNEQVDELILELVTNLSKASFYLQTNNIKRYQQINSCYLNYYLKEFNDKDFMTMPVTLRKAYYYYKALYFRKNKDIEQSLYYLEQLLPLFTHELEVGLMIKKQIVECLLNLGNYDFVHDYIEEMFYDVRKANLLHHLCSLYITQSVYYMKIGLMNPAIVSLSQAQEAIVYVHNGSINYTIPIYNNRIYLLIELKHYNEAMKEIDYFQDLLSSQNQLNEQMRQYLDMFRCEVLLATNRMDELIHKIHELESQQLSQDSIFNLNFYKANIAYKQYDFEMTEDYLNTCLNYFIETFNNARICEIYELLASISKSKGKYKKAVEYYELLIQRRKND